MKDKALIEAIYKKMYQGMISKDEALLYEVLDPSYALVHMTGMRQTRDEFIDAVMDGTLNYYSGRQTDLVVDQDGDAATMIGRSEVVAAVFGGGRHTWRLQQICDLREVNGAWRITRSVVSTY